MVVLHFSFDKKSVFSTTDDTALDLGIARKGRAEKLDVERNSDAFPSWNPRGDVTCGQAHGVVKQTGDGATMRNAQRV